MRALGEIGLDMRSCCRAPDTTWQTAGALHQFEGIPVSIASADATGLAEIFRPIAHPDRIRLIEFLGGGEFTVSDLGAMLGLPATRVSQHLGILRLCRIVDVRPDGRNRYYRLRSPDFAEWIADLEDLFGNSSA